MKNFLKRISLYILSALILTAGLSNAAYCSNLKSINQKMKTTQEKIKTLKLKENQEKSKLVKNQRKKEQNQANLEASRRQYSDIDSRLKAMEAEYNNSLAEFNKVDTQMKNRIRQVYKSQRRGMFELILSAKDLNSLLDVIYFERIIIKNDYKRMMALKTKSAKIAKMKKDIESQKAYLAQAIKDINSQQVSIQRAIAENQNMINKLKTDRRAYERSERELARQSANLQSMISKSYGHSTVKISSSGFMKPIAGRITSPFGWRTHPIFKSRTFHSGVDIGGPNMGSIRASNSGKVIYSGWYGGYGKVVIIDHGTVNGHPTTTLYAHMSVTKVSPGQTVSKGQVIGLEGTTGYSTGPHCHFEVRINGKPNNPLNYI
ncbi:TPA: peptidoglycan DD-metalloendopeptidase family protein [Candidatus Scatousia excrementigallinarum]|uniref:Peptidoglycan DD-metalloendopeptidase family protein n=1 Tax=Candidatus Scatousia excrementigallinarum TaxID=2840935 RepID=A0A9D1F1S3_9BACT|nr:peptidoglycan DD-metalloendopeptidase family protein [Candidatus Scatousia excrementigallinarum]